MLDLYDKHQIVLSLASGKSMLQTAKDLDHSPITIAKVRDERRKQIEIETTRYLESLPKAVNVKTKIIEQLDAGEIDSKDDPTRFKIAHQAADDVLKGVGILPTNANSIAIQNIYNDNRSIVLSSTVAGLLSKLIPGCEPNQISDEPLSTDEIMDTPQDVVLSTGSDIDKSKEAT